MSKCDEEYVKLCKARLQCGIFDMTDRELWDHCWNVSHKRCAKMWLEHTEYKPLGKKQPPTPYAKGKVDAGISMEQHILDDMEEI